MAPSSNFPDWPGLSRVPFSHYGAWSCLTWLEGSRAPRGAAGLHFSCLHRGRHEPVLRLCLRRDGAIVPVSFQRNASELRLLSHGVCVLSICYESSNVLRLRGELGWEVWLEAADPGTVLYRLRAGHAEFNVGTLRRYHVECLKGALSARGCWNARRGARPLPAVSIQGRPGEPWEAALDECESTWRPRRRRVFGSCVADTQAAFNRFLAPLPATAPYLEEARQLAGYINWSSVVDPCGSLRRPAMLMSKNWMCKVWSWDHCFNALALARGHSDLAWDQWLVIADLQDRHGCLPDAVDDGGASYNFTKPPIHGWALQELMARNPAAASAERLRSAFLHLRRWTHWWLRYRRAVGQSLPHYLHGNDSGWDNATLFDQGVPLIAPDLTAFLILQMEALGKLARRLRLPAEAVFWRDQARLLLRDLVGQLWKKNAFHARRLPDGKEVTGRSLLTCMPVVLGARLAPEIRVPLVRRMRRFLTPHGLATEEPESPDYRPGGYWRGPLWAPATFLAIQGLMQSGQQTLARQIARRFCNTCRQNGFAENFDALTGAAQCDPAYTWTSSVFLLLAEMLGPAATRSGR